MQIIYIGGGYVGACSAAVSADSGHKVLVYDNDKAKANMLASGNKHEIEACLFEEGLGELLVRNKDRIRFSSAYEDVQGYLDSTRAVLMCLPTPERDSSGETNMDYYMSACEELAIAMAKRNNGEQSNYILIVNKSTVPIETIGVTREIMEKKGVKNFGVGSNPEFLVEGKAVEGSIRPSRVVVGASDERDKKIFREMYMRFYNSPSVTYIEANPVEAAAGKLLANYILFNKLANTFDVVGRTCEKFDNLQYENIRKIIVSDKRIGDWGFYDSLFAGGSCFIKDSRSLAHQLRERGAEVGLIEDTLEANRRQLGNFIERPEKELDFSWKDKKVGILGLAFKRDTNDVRNSAALIVTDYLLTKDVAEIRGFDPVAGANYLDYYKEHKDIDKLNTVESENGSIEGMDAVIIATDWPQFRGLADTLLAKQPEGKLLLDGRRMLQHKFDELTEAGIKVIAVGSPLLQG